MNTLTIKVGQMPGKLVEVMVERGTTAREIFALAEVEVSNHEVRLDGTKIDMDAQVTDGRLLVAMKMIKGNSQTIKVGQMPGKLVEVAITPGMTAREIFELAQVEVSNHEVRLDGNKVSMDATVQGGNLLVAMKMIKGNVEKYVTALSQKEVKNIIGCELPTEIETKEVVEIGNDCLMVCDFIVSEELFDSIYELVEELEMPEVDIQEVEEVVAHECRCNRGKEYIESKIAQLEESADVYWRMYKEYDIQIKTLKDVLNNM